MTYSIATNLILDEPEFSFPENKIQELKHRVSKTQIVGQDRAIKAIELGLGVSEPGYNIFVMGAPGTGRRTVLSTLLDNYRPNATKIQDIAYAYNFSNSIAPIALFFPAGKGRIFRTELKKAVDRIHKRTLVLLKSESFQNSEKEIIKKSESETNNMLIEFESKALKDGFKMQPLNDESAQAIGKPVDLFPVIKGKILSFEDLQLHFTNGKISESEMNSVREKYFAYSDELNNLLTSISEKNEIAKKSLNINKIKFIKPIIRDEIGQMLKLVKSFNCKNEQQKENNKKLVMFLKKVEADLIKHNKIYSSEFKSRKLKKIFFGRYTINLICENTTDKNYVITENLPSFTNLFGTIESHTDSNVPEVNGHLKIREGAVHRASGGYLIVRFQDLIDEEDSWVYLKRVLQSGKIEIQLPPSGNHTPGVFKPEALPVDFKLIIIGGEFSYDMLYQEDPDFYKLFKVCAEFDSVMKKTDENIVALINLVDYLSKQKNTLPFTDSGYARLVSYSSELAESRNMLTAQFTKISDLIVEADFYARKHGKEKISAEVLNTAIGNRRYLHSLPEEKFAEMLQLGELLIDVKGTKIAKINGLAVEERGYHTFGIPVAVTAQASPGTGGIINIEHEAGLSGEIYDKAHLIISSLLRKKFAQNIPLSISASICFEQSYSYIDGDSASCAEFLALFSAIGDIPMRQDIAVTGSLNQHGMVQPVGGITEKIVGFFNACKILGFTGTQGVVIPFSNKNNLFLPDEILQAIRSGKFTIWTINDIDQGILILSGLNATEEYTKIIAKKLNEFYSTVKPFQK